MEKVPALVQMALFDAESLAAAPPAGVSEIVTERLLKAIHPHLKDPAEKFHEWFLGPKNSVVQQIARQKGRSGGKLHRKDVRRALLHIGLGAFKYLGPCIHALMRTIKNSITPSLNEGEKLLFEHMHESQPYYGNLPAAMLCDRMQDVGCAVQAIWDEPRNPEHIRVLHRLLYYYSEMAGRRRQADKQSKNRPLPADREQSHATDERSIAEVGAEKIARLDSEHSTKVPSRCGLTRLHEELYSPAVGKEDPFWVIGEYLRELGKINCPADCSHWEYHREGESREEVTIRLRCECGQIDRTVTMAMDEFVEHAEKAIGLRRLPSTTVSEAETLSAATGKPPQSYNWTKPLRGGHVAATIGTLRRTAVTDSSRGRISRTAISTGPLLAVAARCGGPHLSAPGSLRGDDRVFHPFNPFHVRSLL